MFDTEPSQTVENLLRYVERERERNKSENDIVFCCCLWSEVTKQIKCEKFDFFSFSHFSERASPKIKIKNKSRTGFRFVVSFLFCVFVCFLLVDVPNANGVVSEA